jgi:hypothetical protein
MKLTKYLFAATLVLMASVNANASVIFQDNFDAENGGNGVLNYTGFANWTTSDGTVDLIGNGYYDFLAGNGLYIDMDGSTGDAGKMTSIALNLAPGTYTLSFELAGNRRNGATEGVEVLVDMGSLFSNTYSLNKNDPFQLYTETFTVLTATTTSISFEGAGGDNIGMLLDDVTLTAVSTPAALSLLGLGLVGLGFSRRQK